MTQWALTLQLSPTTPDTSQGFNYNYARFSPDQKHAFLGSFYEDVFLSKMYSALSKDLFTKNTPFKFILHTLDDRLSNIKQQIIIW